VRRELGGERRDESFSFGHVITNPANVTHSACWDQVATYTVITIENDFFDHTAYECRYPDRIDFLPQFPRSDPFTYGISQLLGSEIQCQRSANLEYIDQLATDLVIHLLQNYCSIRNLPENNHVLSTSQLQSLLEYIEDNLSRKIRLEELANFVGMSRYHFSRLFKKTTSNTPAQYITQRRLERATHLLKTTNLDVGSIARQTGFYDHSHLCRIFRENLSGATPDQYRKN
jgi:AraC family transcriptional regulator